MGKIKRHPGCDVQKPTFAEFEDNKSLNNFLLILPKAYIILLIAFLVQFNFIDVAKRQLRTITGHMLN